MAAAQATSPPSSMSTTQMGDANDVVAREYSKTIDRIFAEAQRAFETEAGVKIDQTGVSRPATIEDFLHQVEREENDFHAYRTHRHPNFVRHLKTILKPLNMVGNFLSGPISNIQPGCGMVLSAISYLMTSVDNVSIQFDTVEALFARVESVMAEMKVLELTEMPPPLQAELAKLMAAIIKICAMSKKLSRHHKFMVFSKGVLMGQDPAVKAQLDAIDQLRINISGTVGMLNLKSSLETNSMTIEIRDTMKLENQKEEDFRTQIMAKIDGLNTSPGHNTTSQDVNLQHTARIVEVLQPISRHKAIFNSFRQTRAKSTGSWILENQTFKDWVEQKSPILSLSGGPGTGKSSLSTHIIGYLQQRAKEIPDVRIMIGYFYFKEGESDLRSIKSALSAMIFDMTDQNSLFFKHVYQLCMTREGVFQNSSLLFDDVIQAFLIQSSFRYSIYLIFDGLDEARENELMEFLRNLNDLCISHAQSAPVPQVLLVGRPDIAVFLSQAFEKPLPEINLSADTNASDVELFVKERVPKLRYYKKLTTDLRKEIRQTLLRKANGIFLWVQLMLGELEPYWKSKSIQEILNKAPEAIIDMFAHILQRLSKNLKGDEISDFNDMLAYVTWAQRPISLGELQLFKRALYDDFDGEDSSVSQDQVSTTYASFFHLTLAAELVSGAFSLKTKSRKLSTQLIDYAWDYEDDKDDAGGEVAQNTDIGEMYDFRAQVVNFNHISIQQFFQGGEKTLLDNVGIDGHDSRLRVLVSLLKIMVNWKKWTAKVGDPWDSTDEYDKTQDDAAGESKNGNVTGKTSTGTVTLEKKGDINRTDHTEDDDDDDGSAGHPENGEHDHEDDDDVRSEASDDQNLYTSVGYAATFWHSHLRSIKIEETGTEDRVKVIGLLLQMFNNELVTRQWVGNAEDWSQNWIETNVNRQAVCEWLQAVPDAAEADVKAQAASVTEKTLLDPIINDVIAWAWLQDRSEQWSPRVLYQQLRGYHQYVSPLEGIALPSTTSKAADATNTEVSEADIVRRIALHHKTEQTLAWHEGVAYTLMQLHLFDEALAETQLAISRLDRKEDEWRVVIAQAWLYKLQKKPKETIEALKHTLKLMDALPDRLTKYRSWYWLCRKNLATMSYQLGDNETLLEQHVAMFNMSPRTSWLVGTITMCRVLLGRRKEAMEFLEQLQGQTIDGMPGFVWHLIGVIWDGGTSMVFNLFRLCQDFGKLEWAKEVLEEGIVQSRKKGWAPQKVLFESSLASLRKQYFGQRREAINTLEKIIDRTTMSRNRWVSQIKASYVTANLCNYYLAEVFQSTPEGRFELAHKYLSKLATYKRYENANPAKSLHSSTLTEATIYAMIGNVQKAKEIMKPFVKTGVELLTDTDDANDYLGYNTLRDALQCCDVNTMVRLEEIYGKIIVPETANGNTTNTSTSTNDTMNKTSHPQAEVTAVDSTKLEDREHITALIEAASFQMSYLVAEEASKSGFNRCIYGTCSNCVRPIQKMEEMVECTMCLMVTFCTDCHQKLISNGPKGPNGLGRDYCDPGHPMLFGRKMTVQTEYGKICFEGRLIELKEWLDMVKKEWGMD